MELGERKLKILSIITSQYIKNGEPVGSKVIADSLDFSLSSATIRNEMAELEELGFLEKPHTSAGRIPSAKGFRLYINELMDLKPISDTERRKIYGNLSVKADNPEYLINYATRLLAGMTNFAVISTNPSNENAKVRYIEFVKTGSQTAMIIIMTSNGGVLNKTFRCDYNITPDILRIFHKVFNARFSGILLKDINADLIRKISIMLGDVSVILAPALRALVYTVKEALKTDVNLEGQTNLFFVPGFEINSAKRTIDFLNKKENFLKLINPNKNGVNVLIGLESEQPELIDSSIVLAKYNVKNKYAGVIGIVGPIRMDYAKIITKIDYLASAVGDILNDIMEINSED